MPRGLCRICVVVRRVHRRVRRRRATLHAHAHHRTALRRRHLPCNVRDTPMPRCELRAHDVSHARTHAAAHARAHGHTHDGTNACANAAATLLERANVGGVRA